MKTRILLILISISYMLSVHAQSSIYVIFSSSHSEAKGVWHSAFDKRVDDRDMSHLFTLFDRAEGNKEQKYFYRFIYENLKENPDNPAFYDHQSILDSKTVIDWDLITSKEQAKEKSDYILSHDKIYFIDRKETTSSTIKIYPTKLFKLNYY